MSGNCWRAAVLTAAGAPLLAVTAIASAGATVTPFSSTTTETFQGALAECFNPDLVGTNVVTDHVSGQIVATPSGGFEVSGVDEFSYRVDFPDGSYALGGGVDHFTVTTNGAQATSTDAIKEPRVIYDSAGNPIVQVVIHAVEHVTYRDSNGNGQPDPGEISAFVDHFLFTCM